MNLGQLKKALKRFSSDLDDSEIVFMFEDSDGQTNYDLLAFVSYAELKKGENPTLILGTMQSALKKIKDGTMQCPDGSVPPDLS